MVYQTASCNQYHTFGGNIHDWNTIHTALFQELPVDQERSAKRKEFMLTVARCFPSYDDMQHQFLGLIAYFHGAGDLAVPHVRKVINELEMGLSGDGESFLDLADVSAKDRGDLAMFLQKGCLSYLSSARPAETPKNNVLSLYSHPAYQNRLA